MGYVVTLLLSLSMHVGWISSEVRAFTGMPSSHHPILSVSSSTTEPWWPTLCLSSGTADNEHTTEEEEEPPLPPPTPTLTNIGKAEMTAILAHLENGTGDTNYVVLDVRGVDEIRMGTGKMSDHVHILPLPEITMVRFRFRSFDTESVCSWCHIMELVFYHNVCVHRYLSSPSHPYSIIDD